MKKRGLFATLFGMAVMSFTIFNSCDLAIGLGSAVDTEVPIIKIENPPTSAIIRDAFQISGTWSDDGSIKDITVELKDTSEDANFSISFKGEIQDEHVLPWLYTQDSIDEVFEDPSSWQKSNPSLGTIKTRSYFEDIMNKARNDLATKVTMLCKDFNIKQIDSGS